MLPSLPKSEATGIEIATPEDAARAGSGNNMIYRAIRALWTVFELIHKFYIVFHLIQYGL